MKFTLLFMCIGIHLFGCTESYKKEIHRDNIREIKEELTFFQDKKTHLCFAIYGPRWTTGLMSNVPCTPEVLAAIAKEEN